MTRPKVPFDNAARKPSKRRRDFPHLYDELIDEIKQMTRGIEDLNEVEPQLRQAFKNFLDANGYRFASKNFDALLKESSGDKFYRNDGTVSWYHQFIPTMMVLSMVRKGSHRNGIDIKHIGDYGGMEVMIASHLRHDSIEDHLPEDGMLRAQMYEMLEEIRLQGNTSYDIRGPQMVERSMVNVDLLSQRPLKDENGKVITKNGKPVKEDVFAYISRLVYSASANPIAFLLKQADIIHNFATMIGAPKFEPARMAKRCNEKENMYGPRQSFFRDALKKWKPFSKVFSILDGNMGEPLYKLFRFLENVELFYKDAPEAFRREPNNFPVSDEFLRNALRLDLPELINPIHIFMKRLQKAVDPQSDPEKYARFDTYMENVILPSLEESKEIFPYMFAKTGEYMQPVKQAEPAPVAFR